MLTNEFCNEFSAVLAADKKLPPKEAFDACVAVCKRHHIGYDVKAACDQFLVHEGNRSGLMLRACKCRENAEKIHYAGADLDELKGALGFEISKLQEHREMQLNKIKSSSNELKACWPI